MGGRHSRTKGAVGEREVCALLSTHYAIPVARELGQARDEGEDIALGNLTLEVKRRKSGFRTLRGWLAQARQAAGRLGWRSVPVVVMREDGNTDWMAVLDLRDLLYVVDHPTIGVEIRAALTRYEAERKRKQEEA